MKKLLSLVCFLAFFSLLSIQARTVQQAQQIVQKFETHNTSLLRQSGTDASDFVPQLLHQATKLGSGENAYFVFNRPQSGFVIVAADDKLPEIVGYTDKGNFDLNIAPVAFKSWLQNFQKKSSEIYSKVPQKLDRAVLPLLGDTKWNQDAPYNNLAPVANNGRHCYTGCVATAIAQVMSIQKWPAKSANIPITYYTHTKNYKVQNSMNRSYNWDLMKGNGGYSDEEQLAVAQLMFDVGCALSMDYTTDGSGARSVAMGPALKRFFNYDQNIALLYRDGYTDSEWYHLIRYELDRGRAVVYNGAPSKGHAGHSFVCDGYDVNSFFHINWGWGGMCDGYFFLYNLNPSSQGIGGYEGGYNERQVILVGVQKPNPNSRKHFGRFKINDYEVPTKSFAQNDVSQKVYYYDIKNCGPISFQGKISFDIFQQSDMKWVKSLYSKEGQFLDISTLMRTTLIDMVEVPLNLKDVEDGEYFIVPRTKDENQSEFDYMIAYGYDYHWLSVKVENGQVIVGKDAEDIVNVEVPDFKVAGMINEITPGRNLVQFTLVNKGCALQGNFALCLKSNEANEVLCCNFINLERDGRSHFMEQVNINHYSGHYTLELYIDTKNRKNHVYDAYFKKIGEIPLDIVSKKSRYPFFIAHKKIQLNSDNIGSDLEANLQVEVLNDGASGTGELYARIYREGVSKVLDYQSTTLTLDANATKTLTLDLKSCRLGEGDYYIQLETFNPGTREWSLAGDRSKAKLAIVWKIKTGLDIAEKQAIYCDGNVLHNPNSVFMQIYDVNGRLMIQSQKSVDLSILLSGIYIVKTSEGSFKIRN